MKNIFNRSHPMDSSRRLFMRKASVMGALTGAGAPLALNLLAAGSAAANAPGDYKALVCIDRKSVV